MPRRSDLVDLPADIVLSPPQILAKGYRDYNRYRVTLRAEDLSPVTQERDVLIAGKVVLVLPVDVTRQEIIMVRQFRLPAHLANGCGDLVEFVAGRLEAGETLTEAARRECREETGITPNKLVELFSYLSTPGLTDEEITVFLAAVDAAQAREGPLAAPDGERLYVHRVPIDAAIGSLSSRTMRGGPLIIGLQWLALNRGQLTSLLR